MTKVLFHRYYKQFRIIKIKRWPCAWSYDLRLPETHSMIVSNTATIGTSQDNCSITRSTAVCMAPITNRTDGASLIIDGPTISSRDTVKLGEANAIGRTSPARLHVICYFAHDSGGAVLWWARLCVCVCLSVHVAYGRGLVFLRQGDEIPRTGGNFGVFLSLTMHCNAFAAKRIIQSPITSCSRSDHSVCQATANRNPENSERRRCGLSAGKGVTGVHSAGEVWYLRLPRGSRR